MPEIKFNLKVVSREDVIYDGEVSSITSYNELGVFDVLAQHANFISLINKGLTIRDAGNKVREIKFDNALMKVYKNNVEIYVGVEGMSPSKLKQSNFTAEN
jgi:F0F1-type ATP synthase epsilon subunit